MKKYFLILAFVCYPSIGMTQESAEPAEWIMVTTSLGYSGYTISFSPVPMTKAACENAEKFARNSIGSRYTNCLNITTGEYLHPSLRK